MNKLHRQVIALSLALAQGALIAALARPLSPSEVARLTPPADSPITVNEARLPTPDRVACRALAFDAP